MRVLHVGRPLRHAALIASLCAALAACDDDPRGVADAPTGTSPATAVADAGRHDGPPKSVHIDPALATRVALGPVPSGERTERIRVPGTIDKNIYATARISAPIEGRVSRVISRLGQRVRAGETMAEVSSPELAAAQLEFVKAMLSERLQTRAVDRARRLLEADVIGSAELLRRENDLEVARAEKDAAGDRLRTLGLPEAAIARIERTGRIASTLPIASPRNGVVIERHVADGQVVQPSEALFVVSDLAHPWAIADVPEREAASVRIGQRIEVEVPALDPRRIEARVAFVANEVDPSTRTLRVAAELHNEDGALKPRMLATMQIESRRARRQYVPAGAVVREDGDEYVFVEDAPSHVTLTRVALGPERDGERPLVEPLPPGTRIVLHGAFHLNNARGRGGLGPIAEEDTLRTASPRPR